MDGRLTGEPSACYRLANENRTRPNDEPSIGRSCCRARRAGVDPKLLEILVCPATHGPLEYDAAAGELISRKAGLAYPIRDGIPIMLVSEARSLKDTP